MVIEISNWSWEVGSRKEADRLEIPSILFKLNSILEWNYSKFPPLGKEKSPDDPDKENLEYLGVPPELKPGNVFKLGNQLLGVDSEDALVLISSETGGYGLRRVWEENIQPEIELAFNIEPPISLKFTEAEVSEIPDDWIEHKIPYPQAKIWRDRFLPGRSYPTKGLCLKAEMVSDSFVFPIHLYILDWTLYYNPLEMEEDELKMCTNEVMKWFYDNYPRQDWSMEIKRSEAEKAARLAEMRAILNVIEGEEPENDQNQDQQQTP